MPIEHLAVCPGCQNSFIPLLGRRDLLRGMLWGSLLSGASLLLPQGAIAAAHHANALVLTCIDFRFVGAEQAFLTEQHLNQAFDWVALAGASLALTGFPHPAEAETFWDQLVLSKTLHAIERVILMDHQDCGAYASKFGAEYAPDLATEIQVHTQYLNQAAAAIRQRYPNLEVEGYFVKLDGSVIRLFP